MRSKKAFTLIELLVVIVILSVLMAVALPTYLRQQSKAKDSNAKSQLTYAYRAIRSALPEYGDVYPGTSSVISAIQQSEPELTVASGGCNVSTDDKHITVDPLLSNSSKLALYTKSSSGTWWRLSAGTSGAQVFTPLGTCQGSLSTGTLTASGNEITDTTRAAAVQGDGAAASSSYGIWEGTTNLIINGGMENSAGSWQQRGTNTIARSTAFSKFGAASLQATYQNDLRLAVSPTVTAAASTTYAASAWVYIPSDWDGGQITLGDDATFVGRTIVSSTSANMSLRDQWQQLTYIFMMPASGATGALHFRSASAPSAGRSIYIDGVQVEQKAIVTPYVDTNGATATRSGAELQAPATAITAAQGWVAMRVQMGWSSSQAANVAGGFPQAWNYTDATGQNGLQFIYRALSADWRLRVYAGGSANMDASTTSGATFNTGDTVTLVGAWKTVSGFLQVSVSVNGVPFASATSTLASFAGRPTFPLGGTLSPNQQIDSSILWTAAGTGVLTDSDAATIASWGSNDPTSQDFPAAAQAKFAWDADTSTYLMGN